MSKEVIVESFEKVRAAREADPRLTAKQAIDIIKKVIVERGVLDERPVRNKGGLPK